MTAIPISDDEIERKYKVLGHEAEEGGYHLNPDAGFAKKLVHGLLVNEARYGYPACPCRLSRGIKSEDLDIICPCDYRDPDLDQYAACYCALYVSDAILSKKQSLSPVPERRPPRSGRKSGKTIHIAGPGSLPYPVWRCRVCGYLCARDEAPLVCPVCKAKKDRFERFM
jgi:ferredoxin-thioredoxin reductase catalytic subunit/rubredoxin